VELGGEGRGLVDEGSASLPPTDAVNQQGEALEVDSQRKVLFKYLCSEVLNITNT
jgi:hypothetical protein